jgi:peptide/nickel transport system permease protein
MPDHSRSSPAEEAEGRYGDPGSNPLAFSSETTRSAITTIVDEDTDAGAGLAKLDPDQIQTSDVVKKRFGIGFWIAIGWLAVISGLAALADFLPLADPEAIPFPAVVTDKNLPPFSTNSTNQFLVLIGGFLGLLAGYFRGRLDNVIQSLAGVIIAVPALLLAIALVEILLSNDPTSPPPSVAKSMLVVALAIGIPAIGPLALLVRSSTLQFGQREFVLASRTLGASHLRVIIREILPNVILPVISFAFLAVALAIIAEGGLSFFGRSVPSPTPTWGIMLNEGRQSLSAVTPTGKVSAWWVPMVPIVFLVATIFALNLAGDRLRRYINVRAGVL